MGPGTFHSLHGSFSFRPVSFLRTVSMSPRATRRLRATSFQSACEASPLFFQRANVRHQSLNFLWLQS